MGSEKNTEGFPPPYAFAFGAFSPNSRITICRSFHASPFWMVGDCQLASVPGGIVAANACRFEVVEAPAQLRHRSAHCEQRSRCHRAQRDDNLGFDHCDLAHQEGRACVAFLAFRRSIPRRTALHDIRDVNLPPLDPHRLEHVIEQLPSAAHEGLALLVFIGARALADKHQFGLRIPHAKNDLLPSLLVQRAARAVAQVFADQLQRLRRIAHTLLGLGRHYLKHVLVNRDRHRDRRDLSWTHLFARFWPKLWSIGGCGFGEARHFPPVEVVDS